MAELLIVVAIIAALSGISFVAVHNYQRGLAQLERDAIAKEIFIAAQNHLTMADSQGYLGIAETEYGAADGVDENIFYYAVNGTSSFSAAGSGALNLMLPFAAVDETVRTGGSYIIRYHKNPAVVLDVFYTVPTGRYKYTLTTGDYNAVLGLRDEAPGDKKRARRNCGDLGNTVLGWYGGDVDLETGATIASPAIRVLNREKLTVEVTDANDGNPDATLKLILEGATSGAKAAITLVGSTSPRITGSGGNYVVVLDDITNSGLHFTDLNDDTSFQFQGDLRFSPGEDITVSAVSFSATALTNIAYSNRQTTNSLFADIADVGDGATAYVGNFRHLENLDHRVSNLDNWQIGLNLSARQDLLKVGHAVQIADLSKPQEAAAEEPEEGTTPSDPPLELPDLSLDGDGAPEEENTDLSWGGFLTATGGSSVYPFAGAPTKSGCYFPVTPDDGLTYDGQGHSVTGVVADYDGNAGMFGTVTGGSVSNLELIDFSITSTDGTGGTGGGSTGSAGALAGAMSGVEVKNVLARNSQPGYDVNVTADGSAGGLIGSVAGGSMAQCAAALTVKSTGGDAGGLIGAVSPGATVVTGSYSGGHTKDATYRDGTTPIINVIGAASAGGLIGDAGSASVSYCYATCSVSGGENAGGLVGEANVSLSHCYATGLVTGSAEGAVLGALAGSLKDTAVVMQCSYFEIINGDMPALGAGPTDGGSAAVSALDADLASYNSFVGNPETDWQAAKVYDPTLTQYYGQDKFSLETVAQLGATLATDEAGDVTDFVAVHYGDWPAPETFVENTAVGE